MTTKYIWSVATLSGWFIFTFTWGTVPSMLKLLSVIDDLTGIPIKASTQRHYAGLTLTSSYTSLFFLLLNITSAHISWIVLNCTMFCCYFFPLLLLFLCLIILNGFSGQGLPCCWMPVRHPSHHEHNCKETWCWTTFSHQFYLAPWEHAKAWWQ